MKKGRGGVPNWTCQMSNLAYQLRAVKSRKEFTSDLLGCKWRNCIILKGSIRKSTFQLKDYSKKEQARSEVILTTSLIISWRF